MRQKPAYSLFTGLFLFILFSTPFKTACASETVETSALMDINKTSSIEKHLKEDSDQERAPQYLIDITEESTWFPWESWSDCSAICGVGERTRWRHCNLADHWGVRCKGVYTEVQPCTNINKLNCLTHPAQPDSWGPWGRWGECSGTCGKAARTRRTRHCLPTRESLYCVGKDTEERGCIGIPVCSVGGGWSQWERWSDCIIMTCSKGIIYRKRSCSNPMPLGTGKRCIGSSVAVKPCDAPRCRFTEVKYISAFKGHSTIIYPPQPTTPYLSILLHFRPVSSEGMLLRHTGIPHDLEPIQSSEKIVKQKEPYNETYGDGEYISVFLEENHVVVSLILNGSDPIQMEAGEIKVGHWNVFRLLIVSDVIKVRVNEGDNVIASLQDSPVRPPLLEVTHKVNDPKYWGNLWSPEEGFSPTHPDAPRDSIVRSTRAILASVKGKISLGRYKGDSGFRGYISLLRINFKQFSLKRKEESLPVTLVDPVAHFDVETLLPADIFDYEEANLPYFDGKHRLYIPFVLMYWVKQPAPHFQYTYDPLRFKATHLKPKDLASLEVIFKPEGGDAILLFNRGKHDLATQWKVVIEDGIRVKFIHARRGGKIDMLVSNDTLRLGGWNKIRMFFFTNGEVRLILNGASRAKTMLIDSKLDLPGELLIVGGHRKFDHAPPAGTMKRTSAFTGYVYSVKQNKVEYLLEGRQLINIKGMPSSLFMNKPLVTSFWYFKPAYQHEPSVHLPVNATWFNRLAHQVKATLRKVFKPLRLSQQDSNVTNSSSSGIFNNIFKTISKTFTPENASLTPPTPALPPHTEASMTTLKEDENVREVACVIPVSEEVTSPPTISWYKDDVPLSEDAQFKISESRDQASLRSSVFLLPSSSGSKVLSGVYSCVVKDGNHHWLFLNHVVAVINNKIVNPDSIIHNVITFVRKNVGVSETVAIFIVTGAVAGVLFVLVMLCILFKCCRRGMNKRKSGRKKSKRKRRRRRKSVAGKLQPSTGWRNQNYSYLSSSDSLLLSDSDSDIYVDAVDLFEDSLFKPLL